MTNVVINLDVGEIYTKEVKPDSKKGGRVYLNRSLVGKKVIVLTLKKNSHVSIKKKGSMKYTCKNCGGQPDITVPPYQRKNKSIKICTCEDPKLV